MMRAAADTDTQKMIDADDITMLILLDYRKADFDNLQEGRPVNKSHRLSMRLKEGLIDEKKRPGLEFSQKVLYLLNENPESHLHKQVKFDSGSTAPLEFSSLAATGGSDLGTSVYGGARISLYDNNDYASFSTGKQRTPEWLASMYVAAFQAIHKHGDTVEFKHPVTGEVVLIPSVLQQNYPLCPTPGGTKGGSSLLNGLGNMLAFRMAWQGKDEPQPKDLKHFVECVQDTFGLELDGNFGGPFKRQLLGAFAQRYFADILQSDGEEENTKKLTPIGEIPYLLTLILTRSTLDISKTDSPGFATGAVIGDETGEGEEVEETAGESEGEEIPTEPEVEVQPTGRRKKLAPVAG